ncbi:MAG: hypothetical protein QM479_07945, partial [Pseudomonadota bacterium]
MNKKIIGSAIALALTAGVSSNANATLAADAILNFDSGVGSCQAGGTYPSCSYGATTTSSGSYFVMDTSGDGIFQEEERVVMTTAGTGVTLGTPQNRLDIDLTWAFGGNPGEHYTNDADGITVATAAGNTATIDMAGWTVWWGDTVAGT